MALVEARQQSLVAAGEARAEHQRLSKLMAPNMLLEGHAGEIYAAKFSTDGTCLASAGHEQVIFLWNVYGECENFATLRGHKGAIMDLKFNTDSSNIITGSVDKTVRIWDMETGICQRKYVAHTDFVNGVDVSRRGNQLVASASDDSTVRIFDSRTKAPVKQYNSKYQQMSVVFNDTSDVVFCGGIENSIQAWDLRRDDVSYVLEGHTDTVTSLSLSPNGNFLLSNSMDCSMKQWDVRPFVPSERMVQTFYGHQHNFEKNLLKCSWSPCGGYVTAGSGDRFVYAWDVSTRKILYKLPGHNGSVNATDFHPKEPILLSAGSDKKIYLGEIFLDA